MKYMKVSVLIFVISMLLGSTALPANAEEDVVVNSVLIHETVLSRCGDHQVAFSGVATYGSGGQQLLVDLDGVPVLSSFVEPSNWTVLVSVTAGYHVLTARVHDPDVSKTVDYALSFNVAACENSGGGGGGDETDCCPGLDPIVEQPKVSVPQIKGTTTTQQGSLNGLHPLNSVFRFVFGRTPTFTEWKYWADRYLTDKPAWNAILGAMQWQKLHGLTVGQ